MTSTQPQSSICRLASLLAPHHATQHGRHHPASRLPLPTHHLLVPITQDSPQVSAFSSQRTRPPPPDHLSERSPIRALFGHPLGKLTNPRCPPDHSCSGFPHRRSPVTVLALDLLAITRARRGRTVLRGTLAAELTATTQTGSPFVTPAESALPKRHQRWWSISGARGPDWFS